MLGKNMKKRTLFFGTIITHLAIFSTLSAFGTKASRFFEQRLSGSGSGSGKGTVRVSAVMVTHMRAKIAVSVIVFEREGKINARAVVKRKILF